MKHLDRELSMRGPKLTSAITPAPARAHYRPEIVLPVLLELMPLITLAAYFGYGLANVQRPDPLSPLVGLAGFVAIWAFATSGIGSFMLGAWKVGVPIMVVRFVALPLLVGIALSGMDGGPAGCGGGCQTTRTVEFLVGLGIVFLLPLISAIAVAIVASVKRRRARI